MRKAEPLVVALVHIDGPYILTALCIQPTLLSLSAKKEGVSSSPPVLS